MFFGIPKIDSDKLIVDFIKERLCLQDFIVGLISGSSFYTRYIASSSSQVTLLKIHFDLFNLLRRYSTAAEFVSRYLIGEIGLLELQNRSADTWQSCLVTLSARWCGTGLQIIYSISVHSCRRCSLCLPLYWLFHVTSLLKTFF